MLTHAAPCINPISPSRSSEALPRPATRYEIRAELTSEACVSAGLLEDDLNNMLQFLGIVERYVGQLVDDLGQVVWTDLVQQAAGLIGAMFKKTGIMPIAWSWRAILFSLLVGSQERKWQCIGHRKHGRYGQAYTTHLHTVTKLARQPRWSTHARYPQGMSLRVAHVFPAPPCGRWPASQRPGPNSARLHPCIAALSFTL